MLNKRKPIKHSASSTMALPFSGRLFLRTGMRVFTYCTLALADCVMFTGFGIDGKLITDV